MSSIFEISRKEDTECNREIVIPETIVCKWSTNLEEIGSITKASVNLVLVKNSLGITVCASNKRSRSVFSRGELICGYIDVFSRLSIDTDSTVLIPDVARDSRWNPVNGVIPSLRSYLGLPLHRLNRSVFGVLCTLSEDTYYFKIAYEIIMEKYRNNFEKDIGEIPFKAFTTGGRI